MSRGVHLDPERVVLQDSWVREKKEKSWSKAPPGKTSATKTSGSPGKMSLKRRGLPGTGELQDRKKKKNGPEKEPHFWGGGGGGKANRQGGGVFWGGGVG